MLVFFAVVLPGSGDTQKKKDLGSKDIQKELDLGSGDTQKEVGFK